MVLWLRNEASPTEAPMSPRILLLAAALLAPLSLRADTVTASWYGPNFHGRATASGCAFDQRGLTAASKTLPLGTILRVHYGARSVDVVINDRGPYVRGRSLDLSRHAAEQLGIRSRGVAVVRTEIIGSVALNCRRPRVRA
jgi:rare lipoprotein A